MLRKLPLSLCFDSSIWDRIALQSVLTEPYMQHPILAITPLSRSQYHADASQCAILMCSIVIHMPGKNPESFHNCETAVLGSLLFIVIEILYGHNQKVRLNMSEPLCTLKQQAQP